MKRILCILCNSYREGTELSLEVKPAGALSEVECPRCGKYRLTDYLMEAWVKEKGLPQDIGLALSGLARLKSDDGDVLELTQDDYKKLAALAPVPRTYTGYVDRILLKVAEVCRYPGVESHPIPRDVMAARVFMPLRALNSFLGPSRQQFLETRAGNADLLHFRLLPRGWDRVDQLQSKGPLGTRAFVAMSFSENLKPVYLRGIRPALETCGYDAPFRVHDPEHEKRFGTEEYENRIDDRILAGIRRARFLVVDITESRQAVYYEAGFADGLGIDIIWTGRADTFDDDKCFDTQQNGHITWESPEELKQKLEERIRARGWDLTNPDDT